MASAGYLSELQAALSRGVPRDARAFRSFAYRHLLEVLDGALTEQQGFEKTARETWRFARKQRTWARSMAWTPTEPELLEQALDAHLSIACGDPAAHS
jgi:tRNA A37 N6-isopentenylltransferase MiaA